MKIRILISNEAVKRMIKEVPAHAGFTTAQMSYYDGIAKIEGTWQDVETDFLFEDQFNIKTYRIMAASCEDIDFIDCTYEDFKKAVQERYAKDWPGTKLNFIAIDNILVRAGKLKELPIYKQRGYDSGGKAI